MYVVSIYNTWDIIIVDIEEIEITAVEVVVADMGIHMDTVMGTHMPFGAVMGEGVVDALDISDLIVEPVITVSKN